MKLTGRLEDSVATKPDNLRGYIMHTGFIFNPQRELLVRFPQ